MSVLDGSPGDQVLQIAIRERAVAHDGRYRPRRRRNRHRSNLRTAADIIIDQLPEAPVLIFRHWTHLPNAPPPYYVVRAGDVPARRRANPPNCGKNRAAAGPSTTVFLIGQPPRTA